MNRRAFVRGAGAFVATGVVRPRPGATQRADLVVRGGTVYDGTGSAPFDADVALTGDRISAIGPGLDTAGADVVDARGLAVAPGFIDIHSHSDLVLLVNRRAESKIRQGVTTEVAGQDGSSVGPWSDEAYEGVRDRYRSRYDVTIDFRDLPGFFRRLDRQPAAVNFASMVGTGTIRGYVIGNADRRATPNEMAQMQALVREAVASGACGVSSGLEYVPGAFAPADELVALAGELANTGLPYASHMRNEDDRLMAAVEEALHVGRLAGIPVHVSHLKAQGRRNWWKAREVLRTMEAARDAGWDVTYDRYPYVAYSTGLGSLFPVWSREGGTDAFLTRLDDPTQHPRIEDAVRAKIALLGDWDAVQITSTGSETLAWARGRRLGALAADRNAEPYALLERIIRDDRNRAGMVGFGMSEENTAAVLAHPLGMVCSDGSALATDGPLATGTPHPRSYGTFPRVLGHYCRDERVMPLEAAIHKMTAMPADRLRLAGRGRLRTGAFADLVVFDPDTVTDRATFASPHQYPAGIPYVIVNGTLAIRNGEHTGATPGRVLRPTRG